MSDTTPSPTMNLPGPITLYTEQDSYNFSAPQQPGRLSIDPSFPYTDMDQSRMESTFDNGVSDLLRAYATSHTIVRSTLVAKIKVWYNG